MRIRNHRSDRSGAVAVEFAFVLPLLVVLLLGLWEVGRIIQVQQILSNSARDGARVAAQGLTINSSGDPTQIMTDTGSVNVKQTVYNYLRQAGLNVSMSDITVTFTYLNGNTSNTQPYQATKGQEFRVTVSIPLSKVEWIDLGPFNPPTLTASAVWFSTVDDPFTVDPTMPTW
jgi:Flp pilus assembly protein TadG